MERFFLALAFFPSQNIKPQVKLDCTSLKYKKVDNFLFSFDILIHFGESKVQDKWCALQTTVENFHIQLSNFVCL